MRTLLLPLLLFIMWAMFSCGIDYEVFANFRTQYARWTQSDIVVAAIEEPWASHYVNGIKLAVKQLNERPGRVLGRRVSLLVKSAQGKTFADSRRTILRLVLDPTVSAVLGHRRSEVAIPAAAIYEASNIIFMPPYSTVKGLTELNFNYVFRMLPDNAVMAEESASVVKLLGHKDIVILYAQNDSSQEQAFMFENAAINQGIGFAHRYSFNPNATDYRELISLFANKPVDMVFLSADTESGVRMIQQLREMGVNVPVMGGESFNESLFVDKLGTAGDNTIIPITYHAQADSPTNRGFVSEYKQIYGVEPDQDAAQGYDSMRLLADAISHAKSTVPSLLSKDLHYLPPWSGVTGIYSFDMRGELSGAKYFFQVLRKGKWHFLPGVHIPYLLERFDRFAQARPGQNGSIPNFTKLFSINLNPDELHTLQLDFLHEIMQFQRLGVVYGEESPGRIPDKVAQMTALGEKRHFSVITCGVVFSIPDLNQVERQLLDCYGKLAANVDALNVTGFKEEDKDIVVRLQRPLKEYGIPVLALQGDAEFDESIAIRVGGFGEKQDIQSDYYVNLFGGILHNIKVYELAEKLNNLPILEGNLKVLNDYKLLHFIGMSQDMYLEWLGFVQ